MITVNNNNDDNIDNNNNNNDDDNNSNNNNSYNNSNRLLSVGGIYGQFSGGRGQQMYNKIVQLEVCGAFSGRGMGINGTAQVYNYTITLIRM